MKWYFIDFEIYNTEARPYKWATVIIESNSKPDEIMVKAREDVLKGLPIGALARAKAFNEVTT